MIALRMSVQFHLLYPFFTGNSGFGYAPWNLWAMQNSREVNLLSAIDRGESL